MQSHDSSSSKILGIIHKCCGWHGGGPGVRLPFGEVIVWDGLLGFFVTSSLVCVANITTIGQSVD